MNIFKSHEAITVIAPYLSQDPIVVEAGAFTGHDTVRMAQRWPKGTIHAFEPVPELFKRLIQTVELYPNIHCYQCALSSATGSATFYISEKPSKPGVPSQAGSVHKPKERLKVSSMQFPYTIQVPTITLDEWSQQYAVPQVDLLWLDIQGHELAVMKASPQIMSTVQAVYTEVSFIESYEGQPQYGEVKSWLERTGFTEVGHDFENQTDWFFGNALFVRNP